MCLTLSKMPELPPLGLRTKWGAFEPLGQNSNTTQFGVPAYEEARRLLPVFRPLMPTWGLGVVLEGLI